MPPSWTRAFSPNVSTVGVSDPPPPPALEELCIGLSRKLREAIVEHARKEASDDGTTIVANKLVAVGGPLVQDLHRR